MKLAISNIAWDVDEDEAMVVLLHRFGVNAIDIAPGKYFPDPINTTQEDIARVKQWWTQQGIEITGMQALLFGTTGLNVFGSEDTQEAMLQHLTAVCRIGAGLGGQRLVFGSPKNRDRTGLSDQETLDIAINFFRRLGDIAQHYDVLICLEPNPSCYGANFMTTSTETADMVRRIAHPAIKMQLDTGALAINGEDPFRVLQDCASLIGHIHASEPNLVPLGDGETQHSTMSAAIAHYLPDHIVAIEMLATKNEPPLIAIEQALAVANQYYRHYGVEMCG